MDIVLLEVGAHVRREYRVNRFAFLELAKGSTFKKKELQQKILYILYILDMKKKTTIKKTQSHTVT